MLQSSVRMISSPAKVMILGLLLTVSSQTPDCEDPQPHSSAEQLVTVSGLMPKCQQGRFTPRPYPERGDGTCEKTL